MYGTFPFKFIINVLRNALPSGICVFVNIFFVIMITNIFKINYSEVRLLVVVLTGFINLRLLYNICKPLNIQRKILLVGCSIAFFELLILLPDFFVVNKISLLKLIPIIIMGYAYTYVISFLEELYDRYIKRSRLC